MEAEALACKWAASGLVVTTWLQPGGTKLQAERRSVPYLTNTYDDPEDGQGWKGRVRFLFSHSFLLLGKKRQEDRLASNSQITAGKEKRRTCNTICRSD